MSNRTITVRRTIQRAIHCLQEALAVVEAGEDPLCAIDDVNQANLLIQGAILPTLRAARRDTVKDTGK